MQLRKFSSTILHEAHNLASVILSKSIESKKASLSFLDTKIDSIEHSIKQQDNEFLRDKLIKEKEAWCARRNFKLCSMQSLTNQEKST